MKGKADMRRIAAGLLVTGLLVGCGQPGSRQINPVTASADAAEAQSSAYVHLEVTTGFGGTEFTVFGDGGSDLVGDRGFMNMKADLPASAATAGMTEGIRTVYSGHLVYMRSALFAGKLPPGKTWIKLDLEKLGDKTGFDYSQLAQMGMGESDPTQMLEFLRAVSDGIEEAGSEEVRGVPTTHYRGSISLDRLAEELGEPGADFVDRLRQMGLESIPVEVWIDDEGLPRRMSYALTFSSQETTGQGASTELVMEFFDYGKEVTVRIPPARKVADAADLF